MGHRRFHWSPPRTGFSESRYDLSIGHALFVVKEPVMTDQLSDSATLGERRSSDRSALTLGLALLCLGLAAGAITALLLAPQSGKQLRRQLRRKYEDAREVVDDWSDQASDWVERGSDWAEKAKNRVAPIGKAFRR
jgi:hypothetical protein